MSDLTTRQVGPKAAAKAIRKAISTRRPIFIWGPPGVGKSEIVAQIAESQNRPMIDIRLAQMDPTDIRGIPFYNSSNNTMEWAPSAEFPTDPESNAIIFLDELVSACPAVQGASYQLILNRRVGNYVLPKNVDIVAAGNREGDRGITYRMPSPLANRFLHLEMRVDWEDWAEWAIDNKLHPDVIGYLSFAKQDLNDFDPKSPSKAFATPRSWTFVSELLQEDDCDTETLHTLIAGAIGDGLAVKFMAHRKIAGKLPNPTDILEGKVKDLMIKEISAQYTLATSLCYELRERFNPRVKKSHELVDNMFAYMMDNFTTEIVVMTARIAITQFGIELSPSDMKTFDRFHKDYGKYVINAASN